MTVSARLSRGPRALPPAALLLAAACSLAQTAPSPAPASAPSGPAQAAVSPQEIAGTWQGTLHLAKVNRDLRLVCRITRDAKGDLRLVSYSIDQGGGTPIVASSATYSGGVLRFSMNFMNASYEGRMSPDGRSITGVFTQGDPTPLVLDRATADTAWAIPEPPKVMPAGATPGLDVATVKPSKPGQPGKRFTFRGRSLVTINTNGNDLLTFAYGLHARQIVGAPDWFGTELFDVDAVPDVEGRPNANQMRLLLQRLLADRFKLTFHREQRELSVYLLSLGSGGIKAQVTTAGPTDPPGFGFRALGDLTVRNMDIREFAQGMQSAVMDRPVVDQTGLKDRYDFTLKWTPDDSQFAQFRGTGTAPPKPSDDPNAPPGLYTAILEQVGIRIAPGKAQVEVFVVDHVERPAAN